MRKAVRTLLALAAAGVLIYCAPALIRPERGPEALERRTLRVWVASREPAVARWLRSRAAEYEKATGQRVYLRSASEEEVLLVRQQNSGLVPPDLMVCDGGDAPVALRGYAVVARDDSAVLPTSAPTALLFSRPAPSPGPTEPLRAETDFTALGPILALPALSDALPGCVSCDQPLNGLKSGQALCALLTAGETSQLAGGYRAVPGTGVFLSVSAETLSLEGTAFDVFLRQDASQRSLAAVGLYSPFLRLYDSQTDALRAMIEGNIHRAAD